MNFKSYELIEKLSDLLVSEHFDDLPLSPSQDELIKYRLLYERNSSEIKKQLVDNLNEVFDASIKINSDAIYFNDVDFQGATYINFKVVLAKQNCSLDLKIQCLLFHNRVILSYDDPDKINEMTGLKKKSFEKFRSIGKNHFYIELSELR